MLMTSVDPFKMAVEASECWHSICWHFEPPHYASLDLNSYVQDQGMHTWCSLHSVKSGMKLACYSTSGQ